VITPYEFEHPWPDLVLIKTRDTDSSEVEVHYRSYASNYQKGGVFVSSFPEQFGPKGTWLAVKMDAARHYDSPDLVLVDTGAGTLQEALAPVTVQARAFDRGFKLPVDHSPWSTRFQRMVAMNGTWLIADMAPDGSEHPPDLVFVQTAETKSNMVELSYASGASGYRSLSPTYITGFHTYDAPLGTWHLADMNQDGRPDLVFVKTQNTDSGNVEIYWALAGDEYKQTVGGFTMWGTEEEPSGTWQVVPFPA
jgi:hypothetical protein